MNDFRKCCILNFKAPFRGEGPIRAIRVDNPSWNRQAGIRMFPVNGIHCFRCRFANYLNGFNQVAIPDFHVPKLQRSHSIWVVKPFREFKPCSHNASPRSQEECRCNQPVNHAFAGFHYHSTIGVETVFSPESAAVKMSVSSSPTSSLSFVSVNLRLALPLMWSFVQIIW